MATTYIKNGLKTDTLTVTGAATIPTITGTTTSAGALTATTLTTSSTATFSGSVFAFNNEATGITAFAGGGQGSATSMTATVNRITVCATAADSVKLRAPLVNGHMIIVINSTANAAQVFGSGTDTINGVATATGVSLPAGKMALFIATTTGTAAPWYMLLSA